MKVTIELTEQQANVVMAALEIFSRLHMGQIDTVAARVFTTFGREKFNKLNMEAIDSACNIFKLLLFPELKTVNAYHGIDSKKIHESARISWDIYQSIRHELMRADQQSGGFSIDYDSIFCVGKEPLPKIYVEMDK